MEIFRPHPSIKSTAEGIATDDLLGPYKNVAEEVLHWCRLEKTEFTREIERQLGLSAAVSALRENRSNKRKTLINVDASVAGNSIANDQLHEEHLLDARKALTAAGELPPFDSSSAALISEESTERINHFAQSALSEL